MYSVLLYVFWFRGSLFEGKEIAAMNNYCGIGLDAKITYEFHTRREENPGQFTLVCVCVLVSVCLSVCPCVCILYVVAITKYIRTEVYYRRWEKFVLDNTIKIQAGKLLRCLFQSLKF